MKEEDAILLQAMEIQEMLASTGLDLNRILGLSEEQMEKVSMQMDTAIESTKSFLGKLGKFEIEVREIKAA